MSQAKPKPVGSSGQITLGKRYAGRYFEMVERPNGEILLRPVRLVPDTGKAKAAAPAPAFAIAEVKRVVMPSREERNARR